MNCDCCGGTIPNGVDVRFEKMSAPKKQFCSEECKDMWINVPDDVCCCGDAMEGHQSPIYCGHSPVSMLDYALSNQEARRAKRQRD